MVGEGYALVSQVFGAPALTPTVGGTSCGNMSTSVQNFLYFLLGGKDIYMLRCSAKQAMLSPFSLP